MGTSLPMSNQVPVHFTSLSPNVKMKKLFLLIVILLSLSCTEKIIVGPDNKENLSPGDFNFQVDSVTDVDIYLSWTNAIDPENDLVSYEIAFGDSVIDYDLSGNTYQINKLIPDHDYWISMIALDKERNSKVVKKLVHTKKSFIERIISLNNGFISYEFSNVIPTTDGGYLISGSVHQRGEDGKSVLLKISSNYSIAWQQINENNGINLSAQQLYECADHCFLIVREKSVSKIDAQGNLIWNFDNKFVDFKYFRSIVGDNNGSFYLVGFYYNTYLTINRGEYFIIKLTSDGKELIEKTGVTKNANRIEQVYLDNNSLLLFGTSNTHLSVIQLDNNGNFLNSFVFPNKFNSEDLPGKLIFTSDNNILLFSSASNYNYRNETASRYVKIKRDGSVIWDQYYPEFGIYSNFDCVDNLNGTYLTIDNFNSGSFIKLINEQGITNKQYLLDFPAGKLIKLNADGKYIYVDNSGHFIVLDPNGYWNNDWYTRV